MIKECLILGMGDDDVKALIELLGSLEFVFILGAAVAEDVELLAEGIYLVCRIRGKVWSLHMERNVLDRHLGPILWSLGFSHVSSEILTID